MKICHLSSCPMSWCFPIHYPIWRYTGNPSSQCQLEQKPGECDSEHKKQEKYVHFTSKSLKDAAVHLVSEDTKYSTPLDPVIVLAWGLWQWSCLESHTEQTKRQNYSEIWRWCCQFESESPATLSGHMTHTYHEDVFTFWCIFPFQYQDTTNHFLALIIFSNHKPAKFMTCKKMSSFPPSTQLLWVKDIGFIVLATLTL